MSWVAILWPMIASACLTLAGIHVLVWFRNRTAWANLLFSMTAVASAAFTLFELWMMRAQTPEELARAMRWGHVVVFLWIASIAWFVRLYLGAGRPGLAWTVCGLRGLSLLPNFLTGQNLNYLEITGLRQIPFLGESVTVSAGGHTPVIFVTAHHDPASRAAAEALGCTAYFRKTDSGTDVLEAIRRVAV